MIDYHVHLWPHGQDARPPTVDEIASYCEAAGRAGVAEIALTEHLFRFRQAADALGPFWQAYPDRNLHAVMAGYWAEHARADLDEYVAVAAAARDQGLPVVVGLEVDHYPGLMDKVGALLAGYPFDVLLGSVHWLGSWLFDYLEDGTSAAEWGRRGIEAVWDAYTAALEELAASGVCDVLAHPDLIKVGGHRPAAPAEFHARMAEAAAGASLAAEVSSAGWRKPAAEQYPAVDLLARFRAAGVPVTAASDTHGPAHLGDRAAEVAAVISAAGYDSLCGFRRRAPVTLPLVGTAG